MSTSEYFISMSVGIEIVSSSPRLGTGWEGQLLKQVTDYGVTVSRKLVSKLDPPSVRFKLSTLALPQSISSPQLSRADGWDHDTYNTHELIAVL